MRSVVMISGGGVKSRILILRPDYSRRRFERLDDLNSAFVRPVALSAGEG